MILLGFCRLKPFGTLDILTSKSFTVWRLMHNKIPIEKMPLWFQSTPFFSNCLYAIKVWMWFRKTIKADKLHFNFTYDTWNFCSGARSSQCSLVLKYVIVFMINSSWNARNLPIFKNQVIPINSTCSDTLAQVKLFGFKTNLTSRSSMENFPSLKLLMLTFILPRLHQLKKLFGILFI